MGGEPNSTRVQMKKVIEFETRLAKFTEPDEDKRDEEKAYHIISISELQNLAPFVRIYLICIYFHITIIGFYSN